MANVWKILVPLGLVLPVAAFVGGSLAASSADEPERRSPIVISEGPAATTAGTPAPEPSATPSDDRGGDDRGGDDRGGDDTAEVVTPQPGTVDDSSGSGHGGSSNSGSNSGSDDDGDDGDDDRGGDDDDDGDDVGDDGGDDD